MLDNTGDQSDVMFPLIELGSLLANNRERAERGLGGGAVDKLLVGLGEENQLSTHRPLFSFPKTKIQFSGFSLHFLVNNQ